MSESFICYFCGKLYNDEDHGHYTLNGKNRCWECGVEEALNEKLEWERKQRNKRRRERYKYRDIPIKSRFEILDI